MKDQDEKAREAVQDEVVDVELQSDDDTDASIADTELAKVQRQLGEACDREIRALAELENTRKRASKEVERVRKYALEAFALALLEVKDNLERSLDSHVDIGEQQDTKVSGKIREGVDLTLKSMQRVFDDFKIEEIAPVGQSFNPELHQAISTLKTADHLPNTVIELIQKGYTLKGRLLRAAMVVVAASPDNAVDTAKEVEAVED